jgi:acetyl-CoA acetyltransferase
VTQSVHVLGVGMTEMDRRDLDPATMALRAATAALEDAGTPAAQVGLVVVANAAGGRLCDQGCIRGQTWLRTLGLQGAPVVNVDNSCGGGASAMHLGYLSVLAGQGPALVVGVEKMWTGDRWETLAGVEDGLPSPERAKLHEEIHTESGSILMGLNARWLGRQMAERGTTMDQVVATAVKARACATLNPLAQWRGEVTAEDVLRSPMVASPLTRLMCSSFTDGAAAAVLGGPGPSGAPRVRASVVRSGNGDIDYHDRLRETAQQAFKTAGVGPEDIAITEVHDATCAEELYAVESLGFFGPGEAGVATAAGQTAPGGGRLCINPSGGLVGRGHPLAATGLAQLHELVTQLRGRAGGRQVPDARLAMAVNSGGIIGGDAAFVGIHVLERG